MATICGHLQQSNMQRLSRCVPTRDKRCLNPSNWLFYSIHTFPALVLSTLYQYPLSCLQPTRHLCRKPGLCVFGSTWPLIFVHNRFIFTFPLRAIARRNIESTHRQRQHNLHLHQRQILSDARPMPHLKWTTDMRVRAFWRRQRIFDLAFLLSGFVAGNGPLRPPLRPKRVGIREVPRITMRSVAERSGRGVVASKEKQTGLRAQVLQDSMIERR
ncbi:hypothetical protein IWZ03DRAFT_3479 [Phyllosticta citriasiana]|uniref:Uncharacterized protein n=1 Tax=Phyllosticta citriasiana TaxID=595635 RepID=A0ABR1KX97_9PEZI